MYEIHLDFEDVTQILGSLENEIENLRDHGEPATDAQADRLEAVAQKIEKQVA